MRLDQYISQSTMLSRKQAKYTIMRGEITIDGLLCKKSQQHVKDGQEVHWLGDLLKPPGELYFMLHKPAGFACSHVDDGYTSALSLLPEQPKKLIFAGRLDADTTGLVLLSSDGKWCHRVTSPKQQSVCFKRYYVTLSDNVSDNAKQQLEQGVLLNGETQNTKPALLSKLDERYYQLDISEGKYHQVKRMFAAVGLHVEQLHRQAIGSIELDSELEQGQCRPLSDDEIAFFSHE